MKIYFGYSVNRNFPVLRTSASPVSFMHIQDKRQLRLSRFSGGHTVTVII